MKLSRLQQSNRSSFRMVSRLIAAIMSPATTAPPSAAAILLLVRTQPDNRHNRIFKKNPHSLPNRLNRDTRANRYE